jgi:HK97 family phage major capsid protein
MRKALPILLVAGLISVLLEAVTGPVPTDARITPSVKAGYRQNAVFAMNRQTQSVIRKFKDTTGNYLWQPAGDANRARKPDEFPLYDVEDMPDITANSFSVAFGDFNLSYLVVDRAGVTVLLAPYTAKPYVLFYTTKRVGGGVQDFDAIMLLKFAIS